MITFLEISLRVVTPSCFYTAISQNASAEDPLSAWSVSLVLPTAELKNFKLMP